MAREIFIGAKDLDEVNLDGEFASRDSRFFDHESFADGKFDIVDFLDDKDRYWDNINSAVRLFGGIIQDNGDGTVRVAAGGGMWKRWASSVEGVPIGECEPMTLNGAQGGLLHYEEFEGDDNVELTNNAYNYMFVVYDHTWDNGDGTFGKPRILANTNFYLQDWENDPYYYTFRDSHPELDLPARRSGNLHAFTVGRVYKMDNEITIRVCGTNGWNFNKRLQLFGEEFFPVIRARGLDIEPIPNTLKFNVTEGVMWAEMINRFTVREFNMENGNTFFAWYRHTATDVTETLEEIITTYPLGKPNEQFGMLHSTTDDRYYRYNKGYYLELANGTQNFDTANSQIDLGPKILRTIVDPADVGVVWTPAWFTTYGLTLSHDAGTGELRLESADGNPKYIRLIDTDPTTVFELEYVEGTYGNTITTAITVTDLDLAADGTPAVIASVSDVQSITSISITAGPGYIDVQQEYKPIAKSFFDTVPGSEYVLTISGIVVNNDLDIKVGSAEDGDNHYNQSFDSVTPPTDGTVTVTFTADSETTYIYFTTVEDAQIGNVEVTIDMGDGPFTVYEETFDVQNVNTWEEVLDYVESKRHIDNSFADLATLEAAHPNGFNNFADGNDYVLLQLQATDAYYIYDDSFPLGDRWRYFGPKTANVGNRVLVAFIGNVAGMNEQWPNGFTGKINVIADIDDGTYYEYSGIENAAGWKPVTGYVERNGWLRFYGQDQVDPLRYNDTTDDTLRFIPHGFYGVAWIYMVHDNTCHVVYGQDYYTNEEAKLAALPTPLPGLLAAYSTLVGKMTFSRGGSAFENAESPFLEKFVSSGVALHNDLAGLDGGSSSQNKYYHMDEEQYLQVSDWVANGVREITFKNVINTNETARAGKMTFSMDSLTVEGASTYVIPPDAYHYVLGDDGFVLWSDTV